MRDEKALSVTFSPAGGPSRILENIFTLYRSKDSRTNAAYPNAAFAVDETCNDKNVGRKEKSRKYKKRVAVASIKKALAVDFSEHLNCMS